MSNISGTVLKVTLDGVSYGTPMDINVTFNYSKFENENIPVSGGDNMHKKVLRSPDMEGINITGDELIQERLTKLADRTKPFPFSITLASGSTFKSEGFINVENFETETNKATVKFMPKRSIDAWTLFAA
jgi:hypothetical protein